ncbi:16S rRNA (cytosine1402-N4)-methyltransferase [Cyclonatronum proteinivorum]|uniref:Ribosomal RNA small subunit methyltransferase H n=1 Tax=Cyclonatronum proteinivorum TaxID=1457365 RepID=A0A345UIN8_9BACT|nr:16S rRNA (cytosine(1402)-N(4))-methyltransferase RsmH [Cyclonatronum proteinivorum]AXJ00340.1 16S rRNA (cytosine1402-N4)-methyltransferase [Cyclonatronum proteinivorum]
MTTDTWHIPVMPAETLQWLVTDTGGVYIDATLGAGGHAAQLLRQLGENARVFGIDQDDEALAETARRIQDSRLHPVKGNFGFAATLIHPKYHGQVSGILFDYGVSSHQIDAPQRGFTFREDGPLDMRMGNLSSLTARDVVNTYTFERLRNLLWQYGEERRSSAIARQITASRPLETTAELRKCVESVIKGPHLVKSLARVFQAIRIEVNRELEMLRSGLEQSLKLLRPGGRIVTIAYHSLEDRLVKNFFRTGNFDGKQEKDFYGNIVRPLRPLHNKPVTATEAERLENPRSRSARLRAAEKNEAEVQA